jgi:hypothetical protein
VDDTMAALRAINVFEEPELAKWQDVLLGK